MEAAVISPIPPSFYIGLWITPTPVLELLDSVMLMCVIEIGHLRRLIRHECSQGHYCHPLDAG